MLRLSKMTDYAVVILSAMINDRGDIVSVSHLSDKTGLPEPTVSKIMKSLSKSDFIQSVRGASGGYKLTEDPRDIPLTTVISAMEGPVAIVDCIGHGQGSCRIESECAVKARWHKVNEAVTSTLDNISLSDMVPSVSGREHKELPLQRTKARTEERV